MKLISLLILLLLASPAWGDNPYFIDISGYTHALIPSVQGKLVALSDGDIYSRYPSTYQSMQMVALFKESSGLVVYTQDTNAGVTDWAIIGSLNLLRLTFAGTEPTVTTAVISPTIEAAAEVYKAWALKQPWVTAARSRASQMRYTIIANAVTQNYSTQYTKLQALVSGFGSNIAAWHTQWRAEAFDTQYPNYAPYSSVADWKTFASNAKTLGVHLFPYINSILFDTAYDAFDETGEAVAKRDGSNAMIPYSVGLPTLNYACPYSSTWQTTIKNARDALIDNENGKTAGVYLDMVSVYPHICQSSSHGHTAGNAYAHQNGMKTLLGQITGKIIAEGNAEIYMGHVDAFLVHEDTDNDNSVPLWNLVYGDTVPIVGSLLLAADTPTILDQKIKLAKGYGSFTSGTPCLTHEVQENLLTAPYAAVLLNNFTQPYIGKGTTGTYALASTTFNFTSGAAALDFHDKWSLTPYKGRKITISDSANKKLIGYIKCPSYEINATLSTTGVAIIDGTGSRNWVSEETGFNRTDESGYTFEISDHEKPSQSFWDFF